MVITVKIHDRTASVHGFLWLVGFFSHFPSPLTPLSLLPRLFLAVQPLPRPLPLDSLHLVYGVLFFVFRSLFVVGCGCCFLVVVCLLRHHYHRIILRVDRYHRHRHHHCHRHFVFNFVCYFLYQGKRAAFCVEICGTTPFSSSPKPPEIVSHVLLQHPTLSLCKILCGTVTPIAGVPIC